MPDHSHIVLAPLEAADAESLYRWINTRDDVLDSSAYRPVHREQHLAWFRTITTRSDAVIFAIRLANSGALIGTCQLVDIHPIHRSAELRIRIGEPEGRGRGFGTQAVRALVEHGFRDLNLHRIWLQVIEDNARAARVYQKLGFREEGTLRDAAFIDGRYRTVRILALLRHEYHRPGQGDGGAR
jgi:RimJ/RimL family protein N-acetyltransferase